MAKEIFQKITKELDALAILFNKTKDEKYKIEWYKLLKKLPKL
jgi:hypothetical protein